MKKLQTAIAAAILSTSAMTAQAAVELDLTVGDPLLGLSIHSGLYTANAVGGLFDADVHVDILQDPNWTGLTFTTEILESSLVGFAVHANNTTLLDSTLSFGFYDRNGLIDSIDLQAQIGTTILGAPLFAPAQTLSIRNTDVDGDLYGKFTFTAGNLLSNTCIPIFGCVSIDRGLPNPAATASTTYSFQSTYNSPVSAVPEASSIAMMLGGLGLVGFMAARRRKANA